MDKEAKSKNILYSESPRHMQHHWNDLTIGLLEHKNLLIVSTRLRWYLFYDMIVDTLGTKAGSYSTIILTNWIVT